jgi:hypothetical protein
MVVYGFLLMVVSVPELQVVGFPLFVSGGCLLMATGLFYLKQAESIKPFKPNKQIESGRQEHGTFENPQETD